MQQAYSMLDKTWLKSKNIYVKNIYFISDAHLSFKEDEFEKRKREKLLDFLDYIKDNTEQLYILGDLFDFWFEWYHVIPKYWFQILYKFRQLIDSGIKINFITGNHDFYVGKYLEEEIGMKCYDEHREFDVGSKRFFVAHGDGYAKKDKKYRGMKKIIRNPVSVFLYKTFISADLGMQIAKWVSGSSRNFGKIDKSLWIEEYYGFAKKKFDQGFDYVILGHLHCPIIKEQDGKVYINCGDWINEFSYAIYNGKDLSLKWWKHEKQI